ncbi:MerR family transcriptional regulator [Streptomyces sp. NPDC059009]|uniref:MerR family transcriptional regulator n=1 Tax=Streptomyces sp. NPDC059009 TaxID=3346694 RepID=UPI0036959E59
MVDGVGVGRRGGLSIGQVSERTGLSVHTLRLYEREGLLIGPVRRDSGGRRLYSELDVEWLGNCTKFRASGMPLATIRHFAELARRGPGNEAERLALLREHEAEVRRRIEELDACLSLIRRKVGVYEELVANGVAEDPWSSRPDGPRPESTPSETRPEGSHSGSTYSESSHSESGHSAAGA